MTQPQDGPPPPSEPSLRGPFTLPAAAETSQTARRRGWLAPLAAVAVAVASATVPLPVSVSRPAVLVDAADAVLVTLDDSIPHANEPRMTGTYLGPQQRSGASVARAVIAAFDPAVTVTRDRAAYEPSPHRPAVSAALEGLGIAPLRVSPEDAPVRVALSADLHERSLAVALQAFDVAGSLDLARGRTVVALGLVGPQQALLCPAGAPVSARAAVESAADVVVAAPGCLDGRDAAGLRLVEAATFRDVVTALAGP